MQKIRSYGSMVLLVVMSIFAVCLIVDGYCNIDSAAACNITMSDCIVAYDADVEAEDIDFSQYSYATKLPLSPEPVLTDVSDMEIGGAKITKELKIGLVRRYIPRNADFSRADYAHSFPIFLKNNGAGILACAIIFWGKYD